MKQRRPTEYLAALLGAAVALVWPFGFGRRIPLLGWADLGFHELGHMLAIPFGTVIHFLAGSFTQVAVPLGLAGYFWLRLRDRLAVGLMLVWAAGSAHDVSVYVADAPYQRLALIGGQHDWAFLLGRWDMIGQAAGTATMIRLLGAGFGAAGLGVLAAPLVATVRDRHRERRLQRRFAGSRVRPVRNPPPERHA